MSWTQLHIQVAQQYAEPLSDKLSDFGALAITFQDASDTPIFEPELGTTPLWEQTKITALFEDKTPLDPIVDSLRPDVHKAGGQLTLSGLADKVWERVWLEHFKPMRFGKNTWVCPTEMTPPDSKAVNIMLDPGLAFGTGTHPTTALCLSWLDQATLKNKQVLDFGCGSGILAIAALKHGAANATGIDIDPQAIAATHKNATDNHIKPNALKTFLAEDAPVQQYDVVMANILLEPLVALSEKICQQIKPGGHIIMSGILAEQVDQLKQCYDRWLSIDQIETRENWALVAGSRI